MGLRMKQSAPVLGIWKVEESPDELLRQLERKEWYLPFLSRITSEARRKEWLAVRVLLKELTGEEKEIGYESDGAPYLADHSFHIGISHTKGYVAIVLSGTAPVAIDIEQFSDRILKLHTHFLSEEELAELSPVQPAHSLLYWSGKETLFKLIRQQEVDFRRHLHILPFDCREEGAFWAEESRTPQGCAFLVNYRVTPQFVLTYAGG
ncbi:4'-phosphopantetheinyl transferase family protein [Parabacteroides sp. Marseille-P3160]|uniref:4'-phosphopantetheinyl transferase family protein n=1 Tax=Parabacteroides sp. Marseille-P3160 TaxID=1917887 RepID=UPI000B421B63|nr:4'-phosphopantetheinyl transferase family protein [Parabacteroides sp. Marseille-P3160]